MNARHLRRVVTVLTTIGGRTARDSPMTHRGRYDSINIEKDQVRELASTKGEEFVERLGKVATRVRRGDRLGKPIQRAGLR